MKSPTRIYLWIALLCPFVVSAQEEAHRDVELEKLRAEVASLTKQNQDLLEAMKSQLLAFEQQQTTVAQLSQRLDTLETSESSDQKEVGNAVSWEDEMAALEEAAMSDRGGYTLEHKPKLSFGGWAGFAYTDDDRDGTKPGFDAHPLYIYTRAEPAEDWRFFGELEFEHLFKSSSSGTKGDLKVERLYLEHSLADGGRLRAGKFFVPFGYWYNLHWHFLTETLSRPISFNNSYVPKQQVGIEYLNSTSWGDAHISYSAWLGDGPDVFGTNKRSESDFSVGGALFAEKSLDNGVALGAVVGAHQQKVDFGTERNFVLGGTMDVGAFDFRSEVYHHNRENGENLKSAYLSVQYNLTETFGFVYRRDSGDDVKVSKDAQLPDTESDSIGFIWRPQPFLLFKGEYRINDFDTALTEDYDNWNVFSAIKF